MMISIAILCAAAIQGSVADQASNGTSVGAQPIPRFTPAPSMVYIRGNNFLMGDTSGFGSSDERPVHPVKVDSYWIDPFEVTNAQYTAFLNSEIQSGAVFLDKGVVYSSSGSLAPLCNTAANSYSPINWSGTAFLVAPGMEEHPVAWVSWFGAAAYCNWRGSMAGFQEAYDDSTWECDFSLAAFRLPTEAEWEYAARGASEPHFRYPWGNDIDGSRANYINSGDPFDNGSTPVGFYDGQQYPPGLDMANGFGLYDTVGNLWEWVNDWYDASYYQVSNFSNPRGPLLGSEAVLRGGGYVAEPDQLHTSNRYSYPRETREYPFGFRVVFRARL